MAENWEQQRNQIIGLGENSFKKSYYPELQSKISELEISYNNMHTIFNSINDGICIHDEKGHIYILNNQAQSILNINTDEIKQSSIKQISSPLMNMSDLDLIWNDVLQGKPRVFDWTISQLHTQKEIYVQISLNRISWNGKNLLVAVIRDFSERIEFEQELIKAKESAEESKKNLQFKNDEYESLNEELRQTNEELMYAKEKAEESDKLKSVFLQNMSHEIRTPMNAIVGFSEFLNDVELSDEKRKSYTSIIINSTHQLLSIVNDILTISSIETKQEKTNIDKVCINDIIVDLVTVFKSNADRQNLSFYAKQQLSDEQSEIYTDKTKLTQILSNLLTNAFKFTHHGYIEFGYTLDGSQLVFYVKDSGIGISIDMQEKIFERFRQANDTISQKYGGTGLGLSISKAFAELLGGKIWLQSSPNEGSCFYFSIPYQPIYPPLSNLSKEKAKTKTVLIAEDEEFNFMLLEEILNKHAVQILHAKNGKEAIDYVKAGNKIDLILMDIKMPVMDGYSAAIVLKDLYPKIPIIAESAYALDHERAKYGNIFDDYLVKPINKAILKQILQKFLEI